MLSESNVDPALVEKIARLLYEEELSVYSIWKRLEEEQVPPPEGCKEWDVYVVAEMINLAPKLAPQAMPAPGPEEGGTMTLTIDGKERLFEIEDCAYGITESDEDRLEVAGKGLSISVRIPKVYSTPFYENKDEWTLMNRAFPLDDWSSCFEKPYIKLGLLKSEKITGGELRIERTQRHKALSGGPEATIEGTLLLCCKSGAEYKGTLVVSAQFVV